jgi:cytochrome c-type protein NapB
MFDLNKGVAVVLSIFMIVSVAGCTAPIQEEAVQESYTEEELGLRKVTLYNEDTVSPSQGVFPTEGPGTGKTVARAFDNSPPVIPHGTEDLLPITGEENACVGCHMPETAEGMGATPIPGSHLTDLRTGKDLDGELSGSRYHCTQCHVAQAQIPPLVTNEFEGGFRDKEGRSRSNLIDTLNEGL